MASSPAIAAAQAVSHSTIPSPITILLAVAAIGYVLWSRMKGQPLQAKRLLILPVVLTVLGAADLTGHLTSKDVAFLVASADASAVLGAARGASIQLYAKGGELWQRYHPDAGRRAYGQAQSRDHIRIDGRHDHNHDHHRDRDWATG